MALPNTLQLGENVRNTNWRGSFSTGTICSLCYSGVSLLQELAVHRPSMPTMSKSSRTSFSESPRYLEVRVEEETLKKVVLHSVATALASNVFPVPGGPTMHTPRHGRRIPSNIHPTLYQTTHFCSSTIASHTKTLG